jgi:hypothetical protein
MKPTSWRGRYQRRRTNPPRPLAQLSVTVDADLIAASQSAVAVGEAESVSAWVNDALRLKIEHDRRLRGIDDFVTAYEAEYGEITDEEMEAACRAAKSRAVVVRGGQVES